MLQKIDRGFQRLLSHIEDDQGENDEKSAEKIFKKMTKVKKIQGTGHKKSIAAIAKLKKQKQGTRARTQVELGCFVFFSKYETFQFDP